MIPTTDIIYNYDFVKRLYQGEEKFEDVWHRLIRIGRDFEKIQQECERIILELIVKYSGYEWKDHIDEFLPIYLADSGPSLSHPLTLAVNEDPEEMLEDFIYQLAHRNMYIGFKNSEQKKECLQMVTEQILNDLGVRKTDNDSLKKQSIKDYLNR